MIDVVYMIAAAVVAFGVLVFLHELGHFLVAKKAGVGVLTFSIGFGPKVLVRRYGETEYCISAFPLGGYVRMMGEDPRDDVLDADPDRSFSQRSLAARTAIVAAGPGANFVLAVAVFLLVFVIFGVPYRTAEIGGVQPGSPAASAGLQAGDRVVMVGDRPIRSWDALSHAVRESGGRALELGVAREGREFMVSLRPTAGQAPNILGETEDVWLIGVQSAGTVEVDRPNPLTAAWLAVTRTVEMTLLTFEVLVKMVVGRVDSTNLGGPLMIAQVAGEQAQRGLANYLFLVALLSVNLGVLNLLPIPMLDGGHLLFFFIEAMRGRPLEARQRERAQQFGLVLLLFVMVYAFYNDLARLFG
ncbi:MAG: RIP metalloprotease RseP [Deltaproteobacteria bacterium]|nr:RIP metalloprotease RseP [Deltaproteobacteria bacterium]